MVEVPSRNDIGREAVRDHLEGVLASPSFRSTEKYSTLLRYLVDRTLADDTPTSPSMSSGKTRATTRRKARRSASACISCARSWTSII